MSLWTLTLKNQPRGGFPGAEEVIREVWTVSQDLKIRAFHGARKNIL
jgi:hypothetical protein